MKKVIRLTESDLTRIVKRVISENEHHKYAKMNHGEFMNEIDSLCEESLMIEDANCSEINDMEHKWDLLDRAHNSHGVDRSDEFMLCGAKIRRFKKNRCTPRETDRSSMEARIFKPREYDRLHESDLTRIVKRVISEQPATPVKPATTNVKPATTNVKPATTNVKPATTNVKPATVGVGKKKETISSVNSPMTVNLYNDADVNKMVFDSGSIKDTTSLNKTLTDNKGLHFVEFVIKTNLHGDKILRWYYSFPESFMEWSPSGVKTDKEYFNNNLRNFLMKLHGEKIKNPKAKFN